MSELGDDIKAPSQDLVADAERVAEIEAEKARLDPEDPRMVPLAKETARLTEAM